ncbi:MAG: hypothetical protein ABIR06_08060 [Cyclobacteriaceae bacterium]
MRKYYSIPLLFFCFAASLGIFLRWQFISPTPGTKYTFFLHAHSHAMFLGWVFNVLYLAFVDYHLSNKDHRLFLNLFLFLQILVVAMMISFPLQGYGMYSIIFSTLHTLLALIFVWMFFSRTRGMQAMSVWFARIALAFFTLSTLGPFSLGYLMSNGQGQSLWYSFSIYFYLHFQYNGFFLFGIVSLFFQLMERKEILFDTKSVRTSGKWMTLACVPAFLLSTLFAKPGLLFNALGAAAAILQIFALGLFIKELNKMKSTIRFHFKASVYNFMTWVLLFFVFKSILQLFSAHPYIAQLAYELRPVVIAYLHLVLVGVITLFLLAWYAQMNLVSESLAVKSIALVLIGFIGSQVCLILMPWWVNNFGVSRISPVEWIFLFSIFPGLGSFLFFWANMAHKDDKDQPVI